MKDHVRLAVDQIMAYRTRIAGLRHNIGIAEKVLRDSGEDEVVGINYRWYKGEIYPLNPAVHVPEPIKFENSTVMPGDYTVVMTGNGAYVAGFPLNVIIDNGGKWMDYIGQIKEGHD